MAGQTDWNSVVGVVSTTIRLFYDVMYLEMQWGESPTDAAVPPALDHHFIHNSG